ncbi:hypothetical protein ACFXKR_13460 [Streptomyces violascens]|uniref:hypothetical protein n=1 Tax=Streptomyces violascens TaxID=67381 RepID=UPI0036833B15
MEQRTEHQYMPLAGAATDPAYVPGLVPARVVTPGEEQPDVEAPERDAAPEEGDGIRETEEAEVADDGAKPTGEGAEDPESVADDAESDAGDGPVCEMSDRQGSIRADRRGVRLRLADEEADFRWDELSAVEYRTPRWSRRFEIVVYTPGHRRFSHDVEATDRAALKAWGERLDAVLDAYFED